MNINLVIFYALCWVAIIPADAQEVRYPGAHLDLVRAAKAADTFCVARFSDLGVASPGAPFAADFSDALIIIERNLRDHPFKASYCSYTLEQYPPHIEPPQGRQTAPVVGQRFLILGRTVQDEFRIDKMVEPTAGNIAEVERVMKDRNLPINTHAISLPASESQSAPSSNRAKPISQDQPSSRRSRDTWTPPPDVPSTSGVANHPVANMKTPSANALWLAGIAALALIATLAVKRRIRRKN